MSLLSHSRDSSGRTGGTDWLGRIFNILAVTGLGVLLGLQYVQPNKRVLSVAAAVIVIGIAWRLEIIAGIGVMILALPFPRGTTFGSTNLALILLLLVIYLLRVTQRELPRPRPTPIDGPVIGLVIAYIVSFYNCDPRDIQAALETFYLFLGTVFMYGLVVNSVRTENDLKRLHFFQALVMFIILLLAVWELNHPGEAIVRGWIDFAHTRGDEFNRKNVRIGSIFYDYELFADFCGMNLIFLIFLLMRARTALERLWAGSLLALTVFGIFATVTRGPIVSLAVALAYLTWLVRRNLRVVPVMLTVTLTAIGIAAMNFFVATFTRSGDLLARVMGTEIHGLVPDSRAAPWKDAWERFLLHPLIGSGPLYTFKRGLYFWFWPHNLYLYVLNIVGIFGFVFFALMLVTLWRHTKPTVDSMTRGSYLDGYLLVARVQLAYFLVDQIKIEYLRNVTYQYQVWLFFALWMAADRLRRDRAAAGAGLLARAA